MAYNLASKLALDETSGDSALATGDSPKAGTVQNPGAGQWTYGRKNNGFRCDRASSRHITLQEWIPWAYGYFINVCIKTKTLGQSSDLAAEYNSGTGEGYRLTVDLDGYLEVHFDFTNDMDMPTYVNARSSTPIIAANKWYVITAAIFWGPSDPVAAELYVNGSQVASDGMMEMYNTSPYTDSFKIGSGPSGNFDGVIDEVEMWSGETSENRATVVANYYAAAIANPAIYTLRASGGDYATQAAFNSAILSGKSLVENINLYLGGGQSFGTLGVDMAWGDASTTWNSKILTVTTDPAEQSTPAILKLKRHSYFSNGSIGSIYFKKIKEGFDLTGQAGSMFIANGAPAVASVNEDCLVVVKADGVNNFGNWGPPNIVDKNCTLVIIGSTVDFGIGRNTANNFVIVCYNASEMVIGGGGYARLKNNLLFNYGGGGISTLDMLSETGTLIQDPLFVGGNVLVNNTDTIDTVLARNFHLTASSPCRSAADAATATATDIEGVARG